ncbi:MAG: hypothetical protein ACTSUP_09750 [Candidatus Heimdallarchaeaceae archaeon]
MGYYQKTNRKKKILGHKSKISPNQRCTTRRITDILSSTSLANKRCFLLAGGPSLRGFNYNTLKNEFTIGVNKTFTTFPTNICYVMDLKLYNYISQSGVKQDQRKIHLAWTNYGGNKIVLCPSRKHVFAKDIYLVDKIVGKSISLDIGKGIYPGKNSGFGALMLAISMGAKEIFLLGYDMKVDGRRTHWHKGYLNQEPEGFAKKLEKFKKEFEEFAESLNGENIRITNLNPNSALKCFPFARLEDVLSKKK